MQMKICYRPSPIVWGSSASVRTCSARICGTHMFRRIEFNVFLFMSGVFGKRGRNGTIRRNEAGGARRVLCPRPAVLGSLRAARVLAETVCEARCSWPGEVLRHKLFDCTGFLKIIVATLWSELPSRSRMRCQSRSVLYSREFVRPVAEEKGISICRNCLKLKP